MKYIPADKLIAEIEKRIIEHKKILKEDNTLISAAMLKGSLGAYESIESFITSLQQEQPEVEEEKEVEEWWQNWASPPRNEYAVFNKEEFINLARHFYELGLNARLQDLIKKIKKEEQ